ncbi:MAG: hypothetical protein IKH86_08520 [Prevotella sp.]|nr:hypothetical protein [Prevotella sp.]
MGHQREYRGCTRRRRALSCQAQDMNSVLSSQSHTWGRRLAARPCQIDGSYLYLCAAMPPPGNT